MYVKRVLLFLGIGVLFIPLALSISLVQTLVIGGSAWSESTHRESPPERSPCWWSRSARRSPCSGSTRARPQPRALVQIDADRPIGPIQAYRIALGKTRALLGSLGLAGGAWVALCDRNPGSGGDLARRPLVLFAQVVELEGRSAVDALHRSAELVRRRWLRVASLVAVGAGLALRPVRFSAPS